MSINNESVYDKENNKIIGGNITDRAILDYVKEYKIGIFACVKVNAYDNNALDPDTLENITDLIHREAEYINTSIEESDHILALSTCTEPVSTNRLIVFAYIYE